MITKPTAKGPIGIFDSGYGGLTILSDVESGIQFVYLHVIASAAYGAGGAHNAYVAVAGYVADFFYRGAYHPEHSA